jgi:molybdate transport system substrate-binding protein
MISYWPSHEKQLQAEEAIQVKVFSTLAVKKALNDVIVDAFQRESGIQVEIVFDPTTRLLGRVNAGERFDVLIGVTQSFEALGTRVDATTVKPLARTGIGVAVNPGTPSPDISTTESFLKTILEARSVAYSRTGASGIYFAALLRTLGVAEDVGSRATILEKGFVAETVVDGRAEIAIQQLSELLFVPEARIVGPFPAELQHYTEFSAAVSAEPRELSEAQAFISFLVSPLARAAYAHTLLELPAVPGS